MSMMSAMVRMKMAAMAQVFRAQRVWSIHVEKDTSFLGKICHNRVIADYSGGKNLSEGGRRLALIWRMLV